LIGPAHYVHLKGIAVPTVDAFETPLGRVPLDRDALAAIGDLPSVIHSDASHAPEHAIEVEVPFLQMLLNGFAMVPLLVGDAMPEDVADVLRRLWGGPDTLVIASSDLSHYYDYDTARRLDDATAAAIGCGDWAVLGPDNACGFLAIAGLLIEAERAASKRDPSVYAIREIRRVTVTEWWVTALGHSKRRRPNFALQGAAMPAASRACASFDRVPCPHPAEPDARALKATFDFGPWQKLRPPATAGGFSGAPAAGWRG
jgi:hypothetical protein